MNDNNNFLFAVILSLGVLLGWQYFVIEPKVAAERAAQAELAQKAADQVAPDGTLAPQSMDQALRTELGAPSTPQTLAPQTLTPQPSAIADSPRLRISSDQFSGSIALLGARFDDLHLTQYVESLDDGAPAVTLLADAQNKANWQASFGWVTDQSLNYDLPTPDTLWEADPSQILTPDTPVTLRYVSRDGLIFTRTISVDHQFMFQLSDRVENTGSKPVTLYPFGQITRRGHSDRKQIFVLHEGAIGYFSGETGLVELTYDDLTDDGPQKFKDAKGWLGFTDKYWATALVPPQDETLNGRFTARDDNGTPIYRADYLLAGRSVNAGESVELSSQFFAGAKAVNSIEHYAEQGVARFDLLIDWGWFYFLTKPMFRALQLIYHGVGNYGLAILLVTVIIKLLFFPLASRSYETMAKMKKVQPEMTRIREQYANDRQTQQQELLKLYRSEKLNPLAGCLPILIQIPVFFALYKVLYVTLDMRHQPFFGWINDLAAPDPTSLFNLFGLIPWDPPAILMLGVWPIMMGITMFVQMQMNPPPPDPVQAVIFKYMPIFFTFLLASFPAGLVIYWAWNNFLSVLQQGYIMRKNGVPIELLQNLGIGKKASSEK